MTATQPSAQVCHLCALDDYLSWEVEAPGLWRYQCAKPACDGYSWLTTGRDPLRTGSYDGIVADLGILDDLLALFDDEDRWVEYGIVEHRYAEANRAAYDQLVQTFSHTAVTTEPVQGSASALVGMCLGMLERDGLLAKRTCKATGYWRYNTTVTAWARPGVPADGEVLTWATFATSIDAHPNQWPVLGARRD